MSFDKIIYKFTDKRIPAVTGIGLVGDILERADFQNWFTNLESVGKRSKKQIDTGAVLTTFIALLCMGKPDFESVAELQNDTAFYQTAATHVRHIRDLQRTLHTLEFHGFRYKLTYANLTGISSIIIDNNSKTHTFLHTNS